MIYEVAKARIRLNKRQEFFRLHRDIYLPLARKYGVRPKLLLLCDIGSYNSFLDIYEYDSFESYDRITSQLIGDPSLEAYYEEIGKCIEGGLTIEIMHQFPYE